MNVDYVSVSHIRNLDIPGVGLQDGFNVIYGENAQGKSSLLESIHMLCTSVSYRTRLITDVISWSADSGYISGRVKIGSHTHYVSLSLNKHKNKDVSIDNERVKPSVLFKMFPVVVLFGETVSLLNGSHSVRRKFIDYLLFRIDDYYVSTYYRYIRLLKSKNYALKQGERRSRRLVLSLNRQLLEYGMKMVEARALVVKRINSIISKIFPVTVDYVPSIVDDIDRFVDVEFLRGHAIYGPHRDKFYITHKGKLLEKYGSSGQKELCMILLKLAEIEVLGEHYGYYPLFIMDDVDLMLISRKGISMFVDYLRSLHVQTLIATVYPDMWPADAYRLHMVEGRVS